MFEKPALWGAILCLISAPIWLALHDWRMSLAELFMAPMLYLAHRRIQAIKNRRNDGPDA
jgi:hypothetical protein